MKISKFIFLFAAVLCACAPVFGQLEGNPENWCRNGFFPRESESYEIAVVKEKKGERVYFYGDETNCPAGKNCRKKSYLIAGDEVIVSRRFDGFACAWFQPKKGAETVGWLPLGKLEFTEPVRNKDQSAWTGTWVFYDNEIRIAAGQNGVFKITGNAFWKGLGDNVHIGELDGDAVLSGDRLRYGEEDAGEYDCRATMRLAGRFLIVSDNLKCGGVNVTFSGVYRKK